MYVNMYMYLLECDLGAERPLRSGASLAFFGYKN